MTHDSLKGGRLVALFLSGLVLFNYPILSLFNLDMTLMDAPLIYWYLLGSWCLVIGLMILITGSRQDLPEDDAGDSERYRD
jgi:hypothetical protein